MILLFNDYFENFVNPFLFKENPDSIPYETSMFYKHKHRGKFNMRVPSDLNLKSFTDETKSDKNSADYCINTSSNHHSIGIVYIAHR